VKHADQGEVGTKCEGQGVKSGQALSSTCNNMGLSLLERIQRTERIWKISSLSRDEADFYLSDTEEGNFIVRGSSGGTWALSLKFNKEVQHFLILRKGSALLLEDSSLHFSSLLSLLAHYSTICEELPCLLRLPSTLALADSLQALDSFSLLGKDFWKYPMAKFSRRSLLLSEDRGTRSCERNSERREGEKDGDQVRREPGNEIKGSLDLAALSARLSQQLEELSRMSSSPSPSPSSSPLPPISPTRPARRSCGRVDTPTTSPLSTPPTRPRRRVSDSSVVMRVEPGRACRGRGASLAGITAGKGAASPLWVGSPVYTVKGKELDKRELDKRELDKREVKQDKNNKQQQRQRKPSIFLHQHDRLAAVEESVKEMNSMLNGADDTAILNALMSQATSRQSSVDPPTLTNLAKSPRDSQQSQGGQVLAGSEPAPETEYWSMGRERALLEHVYSECGQPENDYSEPLDSLDRLHNGPQVEKQNKRGEEEMKLRMQLRRERFSEGSLPTFRPREITPEVEGHRGKRKLSLGQFVRKLSRGSLNGEGGRGDVKGERLSKLVSRLVGVRRIGSQQVDSSSWEFLSAAESSTNSTPTSTQRSNSSSIPVHKISTTSSPCYVGLSLVEPADGSAPAKRRDSLIIREQSRSPTPLIGKGEKGLGGSRDSVYESEYDSSTGSSLTSQDSALCPPNHSSRQLGQNRALPELLQ